MIKARDSTALRTVTNVKARDAANALRQCQFVKVRDAGGVLRTVWSFLTASSSPASANGYANDVSPIDINTSTVTATVSGGTAPYSYAWSRTDAGADAWTINSPTAAATSFQADGVNPSATSTATFKCTVTDANGVTAMTGNISASAKNTNTS